MAQHGEADEPGDQYAVALYLLGSLAVEERAVFESHVTTCGSCLADSVRLSPVVTAMSMLTDEDVQAVSALIKDDTLRIRLESSACRP